MIPSPRSCHTTRDTHRRRSQSPWAAVATLALAASLGLAACTDDAEAPLPRSTDAEVAVRPTPTSSPTRSPKPERPAALGEGTTDGALTLATYFSALYSYAYNTGDLEEWQTLSSPECIFCTSVIDNVEAMHQKGHRVEGGTLLVTDSSTVEIGPGRFSVELEVTQEASRISDSSNTAVEDEMPSERFTLILALLWKDGAWSVLEAETAVPSA